MRKRFVILRNEESSNCAKFTMQIEEDSSLRSE